jgi:hypothetical protein
MNFIKIFDIHFECGINSSNFYAKTYVDGNKMQAFSPIDLRESLLNVAQQLYDSGSLGKLKKDPSISTFPFNNGGWPGEVPLYYLHMECGTSDAKALMYARTELNQNGVYTDYITKQTFISMAMPKLIEELHKHNILHDLKYKASS